MLSALIKLMPESVKESPNVVGVVPFVIFLRDHLSGILSTHSFGISTFAKFS